MRAPLEPLFDQHSAAYPHVKEDQQQRREYLIYIG